MFKSRIRDTPQNSDSTGNYINDFSNISTVTQNISTIQQEISIYRQKTPIPFLYTKKLLQNGTTSFSIPEPSQ
ncbi:hypothetical protein [Bacillus wiedmannii]|uniref:hypothetical protein n=1 Tax=Bacillus wiedmannii TaxID=1890302 RepID=UPI001146C428|nr:hypothetical protein [Bacillus wiedmannii]